MNPGAIVSCRNREWDSGHFRIANDVKAAGLRLDGNRRVGKEATRPFIWNDDRRFQIRGELDAAFFHLYLPSDADGSWRSARVAGGTHRATD